MATIVKTRPTASREEWLKARLDLLEAEKELTRKSDELARRRQALPWVRVEKDYSFDTENGRASLKDLFRGRSQLLVYHLMFGPDYIAPCPSCSFIADGFDGFWEHLAHHGVMLWAISRAPLEKLATYKQRHGWSFPWASSFGSDFNTDYFVGLSERQQQEDGYCYNYREQKPQPANPTVESRYVAEWSESYGGESPVAKFANMCGVDAGTYLRELPGMSAFVMEEGEVYHTYSTYARGLDILWGAYQWLDRAPLGRNEEGGLWWKRREDYGAL
jgi:predicted dithiol-disulfide oxidoreductase (DUF899 family)